MHLFATYKNSTDDISQGTSLMYLNIQRFFFMNLLIKFNLHKMNTRF